MNMLAGKNSAGQPLTDEQRQQYNQNLGAVSRHYKNLQMQYNLLRSGVVSLQKLSVTHCCCICSLHCQQCSGPVWCFAVAVALSPFCLTCWYPYVTVQYVLLSSATLTSTFGCTKHAAGTRRLPSNALFCSCYLRT